MKIIVIGATGTIGKAVVHTLQVRHTIIQVGHQTGQYQVDISHSDTINELFNKTGKVDAIISTTGNVVFKPLAEMQSADYQVGLQHKLMGQINLALLALPWLTDNGVITLTSGIASQDPIVGGTSAAMVNAGIDGFVRSAAIDLPRGIRINAVSPTILTESLPAYGAFFRGFKSVSACDVALAYEKSIEGKQTGQVYTVI